MLQTLKRVVPLVGGPALIFALSFCRTTGDGSQLRGADTNKDTVAQAALDALQRNCSRCHGPTGNNSGGINYITDLDQLVSKGKVRRGTDTDQRKSRILVRILSQDNPMPPLTDDNNQPVPRPSQSDINAIVAWVLADSPNLGNGKGVASTFIHNADIEALVQKDLQAVVQENAANTVFKRYLTVSHLANSGATPEALATFQLNLSRLINQLSWGKEVQVPLAIDANKTIFRIDLRNYFWNGAKWNQLEANYPYHNPTESDALKNIRQLTGTPEPIIRADYFMNVAIRPPLYYSMLTPPGASAFPGSAAELEKFLNVDVGEDLRETTVGARGRQAWRAGIPENESGVSKNNRMIERHSMQFGAYWKSYDFGPPVTPDKNLNDCPLGPVSLQPQNVFSCDASRGFNPDGGEILWNLPNGLQGYMLINAQGNRLDEASTAIVFDNSSAAHNFAGSVPGAIVAGLSCMACHTEGMVLAKDRMLNRVMSPNSPYSAQVKAEVQNLYTTQADLDQAFAADRKTFVTALAKTGASTSSPDSLLALVQAFEQNVNLALAAAELGQTADNFKKMQTQLPNDLQLALIDLFDGGALTRPQFEGLFPRVATAIAAIGAAPPVGLPVSTAAFTSWRFVPLSATGSACSDSICVNNVGLRVNGVVQSIPQGTPPTGTIGGVGVTAKSSSSRAGDHGVEKAFVTAPSGDCWGPIENSLAAGNTNSNFLQFDFAAPVAVTGIEFAGNTGNPDCEVASFRVDASSDGTNFSPIIDSQKNGLAPQPGVVQSFTWAP